MSFDFEKTNLIHFCRRQQKKNLATFVLKLDDATITPKDHILFLGVYFDTRLTWKIHIEHMALKATAKWNFFMARSRSLSHLSYNTRRTLYKGVIDPILIYCAPVWSNAPSYAFRPIERALYKISRQITGALTNTKRSTCIAEAGLIPIRIRAETVSKNYFDKVMINRERNRHYVSVPPWHTPLTAFEFISGDCPLKATLEMENTIVDWKPHLTGFTDGSVKVNKKAGAGFTWSNNVITVEKALRLEDGSDIFEAEWSGAYSCIKSCLDHYFQHPWSRLVIFTDSLSNVSRWDSIQKGKHPYVEKCLWDLNRQLLDKKCEVKIQWIPSHSEISLNDKADNLANIATMLPSTEIIPFPNPSKAIALYRVVEKSIIEEWFLAEKSDHSDIQKCLKAPEQSMDEIHKNLPFYMSVRITWIRTGHMPLNAHLYRMKKRENPLCKCSKSDQPINETISHYLFQCPRFLEVRKTCFDRQISPDDLVKMMSMREGRLSILSFINQSKRFKK